jgi:hypothetical protein
MSDIIANTDSDHTAKLTCPLCGYELKRDRASISAPESIYCERPTCRVQILFDPRSAPVVRSFRLTNHHTYCIFPFAFGRNNASSYEAFSHLRSSARWQEQLFCSDNPDDRERTEYLLPYARRFLFPSLYRSSRSNTTPSTAEPTCQHFNFDLSLLGNTESQSAIPFELMCDDSRKKMTYSYNMSIAQIQLLVFNYHVGFLIFAIKNDSPTANFFDQMNAAFYFRLVAPLYQGFAMPQLTIGQHQFQIPQLLNYLLQEFASPIEPKLTIEQIPIQPTLPVKPIYDDRMMVYTFSCINSKTSLEDLNHSESLLSKYTIVNFDPLMKEQDLTTEESSQASAWHQQRWWGYSKEGGSLAVFDSNRYHERFLGTYFNTYYFDIFLLAALQRVTLLLLFERLSDIQSLTTGTRDSKRILRRLRKDLLLFKNQSWFSQLTNRERGLQLWKKWQEIFENHALLHEVNEQSKELDTYLQTMARERIDRMVRLGGFLATAVPAIVGLPVLFGSAAWVDITRWLLLIVVIIGSGIFAWKIIRQQDET